MEKIELDPMVAQFKQFIQTKPHLIEEVRNEKVTWQDLYEDWILLGEEDLRFKQMDQTETNNESFQSIFKWFERVDSQKVDHMMQQLSQLIVSIQAIVSNMQQPSTQNQETKNKPQLFSFRKD